MVEAPSHLDGVINLLLQHGQVLLPEGHPLRQGQSDMDVFNDVGAQLQAQLGDEDFALNMATNEGGLLLMLKMGDVANELPDFSPPEPRLL
tara:strand:- start:27 stop:299 length:273 start_codon:yes stop_codon:yes gene_type:complete